MQLDELLRRLALNDERTVGVVTGSATDALVPPALDAKTGALVRLGALLSIGATTASCRAVVDRAKAAGASDQEIVGVLLAVGPAVGGARVVAAAPRLALAVDYEIDAIDTAWEEP